jgi:predicted nuclease with TOPRIM domain
MDLLTSLRAKHEELEARIDALKVEAKPIRDQLANMDRQISKLGNEISPIRHRITELSAAPRVSDHAVIRYLERKYGFVFDDVRSELLTPAVLEAMKVGCESVKTASGTLKLKGKTVVTFID